MNRENFSKIRLIGAPVDAGAGRLGCRMGPDALRVAGIQPALIELGMEVEDLGDLPRAPDSELGEIAAWTRVLAAEARGALSDGCTPIFLGGDHSLSMGSVAGAARFAADAGRALHVIWLDAHADFNTPTTSPSGNMHGMPMAFFCGEPGFNGYLEDLAVTPPQNVHIFGVRSIDAQERALLAGRGVDVCDMRMIDEHGAPDLLRRILAEVAADEALLHVSFDVDFLDPEVAPGVGTTVPGGATFREAHLAMEMICDSGLLTSLDLVELNPYLDDRGRSARAMVELTESAFGQRIFDRPTQTV